MAEKAEGLFHDDTRQLNRIESRLVAVEAKLDQALNNRYEAILAALAGLIRRSEAQGTLLERLMSVADDIKAGLAEIDAETTKVGELITALAGKIKNSMTDEEVASIKGALTASGDHLKTLAVDPTTPVPPEPPPLVNARRFAAKK